MLKTFSDNNAKWKLPSSEYTMFSLQCISKQTLTEKKQDIRCVSKQC